MTRPLVSIVTPTLDQGRFIEQTLRSVREQTYPHLEHIVVDGGSSDGTLEVLRRHEGAYPMRWLSEPDEGMYDAVNKGMRQAQGDILAYLNSDDLYFPWTLEVVVDAFERHPEADLVFGDALAVDDRTGRQRAYLFPPFDLTELRESGHLAQPAVFWRRRVLEEEGPFDTSLRYVADCDYWMRIGDRRRFLKVDEFLAVERDHDATLRAAGDARVWTELATVRGRYRDATPASVWGRRTRRLRSRLRSRYDWARLLLTSLRPGGAASAPWSRMVASGQLRISPSHAVAAMLPRIGRAHEPNVIAPSRYWLERPA